MTRLPSISTLLGLLRAKLERLIPTYRPFEEAKLLLREGKRVPAIYLPGVKLTGKKMRKKLWFELCIYELQASAKEGGLNLTFTPRRIDGVWVLFTS